MLRPANPQTGITLIELMIGLAIVAMLLLLAAPTFSDFSRNSRIRNAAESIQDGLSVAKGEAVRRNTGVKFTLNGTDSSWTVGCVTEVDDTDGDGQDDCPLSIQSRSATEGSSNVSVAVAPVSAASISFNGLGRVTSLAAGTDAVFDITYTGSDCVADGGSARCLRVVVSPGGQVRMCDPGLTATNPTNPQACS